MMVREYLILPLLLAMSSLAAAELAAGAGSPGRLLFQTDHAWSPRTNINVDTMMVYGLDDTTAA